MEEEKERLEKVTSMFSNVYEYDKLYTFDLVRRGQQKQHFKDKYLQNGDHVLKETDFTIGLHWIFELKEYYENLKSLYGSEEELKEPNANGNQLCLQ